MSFNLPLVLREHAPGTIDAIDDEINRLVTRIAELVQERGVVETHLRLQAAFDGEDEGPVAT